MMERCPVPKCWCAHCGAQAEYALNRAGVIKPEPEDAALCNACGEWNIFTDSGALRRPRPDEAHALSQSVPAQTFRQAVLEVIGEDHAGKHRKLS